MIYAPAITSSDEDIEQFYHDRAHKQAGSQYMTIVMSDLNAKLEMSKIRYWK